MLSPTSGPEKNKPSLFKVASVYCLVWLALAVIFVAYVTLAPENGGFRQASAELVAMVGGFVFVLGLIVVLAVKGGVHVFPKPQKETSYYDELPQRAQAEPGAPDQRP